MRPRKLHIEGFASFREPVEIDFEGSDLFVLFGPTGAGKSTVIDALTFALYGSVPRYDDQRLVAPVISQGRNEAKVMLEFALDSRTYRVARVVQRTKTGATTKAASLDRADGTVLASSADEVTAEVEKLLGLTFEHFTRCVVLPQGDFAEFLHAKPGDRQDLLVRLLGLDAYRRIQQAAQQRASQEANHAALIAQRMEGGLAVATEEALATATARVESLAALLESIETERVELEALAAARAPLLEAARDAENRAVALEGVRPPSGAARLADRLATTKVELAERQSALTAAVTVREEAERVRSELPERGALERRIEEFGLLATLAVRLEDASRKAEERAKASRTAADAADEAARALVAADAEYQRVRRERAAHALAEHLHTGEACPVCLQKVTELPAHQLPAELGDSKEALAVAEKAAAAAKAAADEATRSALTAGERADAIGEQLADLQKKLDGAPTEAEARTLLERVGAADDALRIARATEADARAAATRARKASEELEADASRAWKEFDRARDTLAAVGLAPPPPGREDVRDDWEALHSWAAAKAPEERASATTHRSEAAGAERGLETRMQRQRAACADRGVAIRANGSPRDACSDALAGARADAERTARDLATAGKLREEQVAHAEAATVAKELAKQLGASYFERWLMNRALTLLVSGATRVLLELSNGAYSLALDERNTFMVIDHRNAGETRLARTLSGGETFLASLALALALADHVADLSADGGSKLEALFLDEGFGTLDTETLDAVATAVEELGSRGRMVGLVTHVRDLAERIPVRYEVRKVASVSTVEKVVA